MTSGFFGRERCSTQGEPEEGRRRCRKDVNKEGDCKRESSSKEANKWVSEPDGGEEKRRKWKVQRLSTLCRPLFDLLSEHAPQPPTT